MAKIKVTRTTIRRKNGTPQKKLTARRDVISTSKIGRRNSLLFF